MSLFSRVCLGISMLYVAVGCGDDSSDSDAASDGRANELSAIVELAWDEDPDPNVFEPGTCTSAGVRWMEIELVEKGSGESLVVSDGRCANSIELMALSKGTHELLITGLDEDGNELWFTACVDLVPSKSGTSYQCDVLSP